jgi:hypothetical protein
MKDFCIYAAQYRTDPTPIPNVEEAKKTIEE